MKIGIITFVHNNSYGAFLQAFALQYKLNSLGYDAEVIDLKKPTSSKWVKLYLLVVRACREFVKSPLKTIKKLLAHFSQMKSEPKFEGITKKENKFYDFFYNDTRHSPIQYTSNSLYSSKLPYDVYITGSDQVWNYAMTSRLDVYFLKFAKKAKKISYAASFGFSFFPFFLKTRYRKLIDNIDYISVRETTAVNLVKQISKKTVTKVLDPSFLLTKEEWLKLSIPVDTPKRYILVYDLMKSEWLDYIAKEISVKFQAEIITPGECTPKEFISLINGALYVISSSFHGIAFSINFGKKFIAICRKSKDTNSRIIDLLKSFGLSHALCFEGQEMDIENINFDYYRTTSFIENERVNSTNFLINSIYGK